MTLSDRIRIAVEVHVDAGELPGAAWWVTTGDGVARGQAGTHGPDDRTAIEPDTVFRLSSTTKPVIAALAMTLVDDGTLRLDAAVDDLLPELADRRVLVNPAEPGGATVPARRSITVRDVLEFRLGLGMDFTQPWPNPMLGPWRRRACRWDHRHRSPSGSG